MDLLSTISVDNAWNCATALLVIAMYFVPVRYWDCLISSRQQPQSKEGQQKQQPSCTGAITKHNRKVSIMSPLPHPSTDTTEVSEETEHSESCDYGYEIKEVFRSPPVKAPSKSKQVQIIGKPIRLAGIPESPVPALNSALKLKQKLNL